MPTLPTITPDLVRAYQEEIQKSFSPATVKRKLMSLKKFLDWAKIKGIVDTDFEGFLLTHEINQRKIAAKLAGKRRRIPGAIYLNIAVLVILSAAIGLGIYNQFFKTAQVPLALTSLVRPNRFLSFQGRLTNQFGNPITAPTSVVFNLYDAATSGTNLWASGTCTVSPDSDGVFSTLLGSDCGPAIASTVFSDNASVWLGITVALDAEATPRIQIATVAYALNSETLQGYPASSSATINTVPVVNNLGQIVIAASSPKIQSTSGTFNVEGQALTLTTPAASNGNITISPDGTGQLNLTFNGANPGSGTGMVNATDANLTSGSLYYGSVANDSTTYNLLQLQSGSTPTNKFVVDYAGNVTAAGTINGLGITAGTITSGTWHGNIITSNYGGTGADNSGAAQYAVPYYSSTGVLGGVLAPTTAGYVLSTNDTGGIPSWIPVTSTGTNYFGQTLGALYPLNNTVDFLIGATAGTTATTSARIAFTGIDAGGTPTASISGATNIATFIDGNGNISTTNRNNLSLGNSSTYNHTGNILLNPLGVGYVGIGKTLPVFTLDVAGTASISSTLSLGPMNQGDAGTCGVSTAGKEYYDGNANTYYFCNGSTWTAIGSGTGTSNWTLDSTNGVLYPISKTVDVLLGGTATTSAKFAFTGINTGSTPTASISGATNIALFLDGNGNISSTNRNNLVLGNSATYNSTGNILLNPSGTGFVGIGTTSPGELLSLGSAGTTLGVLSLAGNTSGKVTIEPAAAAGTWTFTLPTTTGSSSQVLTTDGTGVTSWQNIPLAGNLKYYFQDTASDVGGYKKQLITPYTPKTTLTTHVTASGANALLMNWITAPGSPGLTAIPAGQFQMHVHASKPSGSRVIQVYAEIWETNAAGVDITKIGTTESSAALGVTETEYNLYFSTANTYTLASANSRIDTRVYVAAASGGSDPDVDIFYGVEADSFTALPSQTIDATNFVPYVGATADVNLGIYDIMATDASLSGSLNFYGTSPAKINALNGDRLDFQTSVGGDTGLAAKMTLLNNGNLGLGTTAPGANLEIAMPETTSGTALKIADTATSELIINAVDRNFSGAGNWSVTGTDWSIVSAALKHNANATDAVLPNAFLTAGSIINGRRYSVVFTVTGRTTGSVTPKIGSAAGTAVAADGVAITQTITAAADNADLIFTPTSGFDGSIDDISVTRIQDYFAVTDTGTLQIGAASNVAYNRIGTSTTGHSLSSPSDLLLGGNFELDGNFYLDGGTISNSAGTAAVVLSSTPTTTPNYLTAGNWIVENTANLGQAALMINQTKGGDIFTASDSGAPKFTIDAYGSATASGNITMGGELRFGNFDHQPNSLGSGSEFFNTATNTFQCNNGSTWFDCAGTLYHNTNAAVANGSYITVTHNQNTNDLLANGWILDPITNLWKNIDEFSHNVTQNLSNQWNAAAAAGVVRTTIRQTDVELSQSVNTGTGADGPIEVSTSTNINTTSLIAGRSCAGGGDAVNYSVDSLTSTTATLHTSPATGCLNAGDEVLLINLQGTYTSNGNVGNYETLRVQSVSTNTVTFTTSKTKYYGNNPTDDSNIGTVQGTNQLVMLQRVPNYTNVTVDNSINFYPSVWNGAKGGVIFFRATGSVSIGTSGSINANGQGYSGGASAASGSGTGGNGGEAFCGIGGSAHANGAAGGGGGPSNANAGDGFCGGGGGRGNGTSVDGIGSVNSGGSGGGGGGVGTADAQGGGGGGYGTPGGGGLGASANGANGGTNSSGNGGSGGGGGGTYGTTNLSNLFFGSAGGAGGMGGNGAATAGTGGDGGGIIYISANSLSVSASGSLASNGTAGGSGSGTNSGGGGGGGAGGSVLIAANTLSLGTSVTTASGGGGGTSDHNGGNGGDGIVAVYYTTSFSGTVGSSVSTIAVQPYYPYGLFHSTAIATPNSATLDSLRWEMTSNKYGNIEMQTRTGPITTALSTDGNTAGLYHLDDASGTSVTDSSGNSNTGTATGTTIVSGLIGNARSFDGAGDYVNIPSVLGLTGTNATLEAWVYLDSASVNGGFVKVGGASTGYGIGVGSTNWDNVGNNLILIYAGSRFINTNTPIGTGWHHVAMTVDGSGYPTAFLDGAQVYTDTIGAAVAPTTSSSIGSERTISRNVKAIIDEVRISNTIRSAATIAADAVFWDNWSPYTGGISTTSAYMTMENSDIQSHWGSQSQPLGTPASGNTISVNVGDVTRAVPMFEDEQEFTVANTTKLMTSGFQVDTSTNATMSSGLVSYWNLNEASGSRADSYGTNTLSDNGTTPSIAGVAGNAINPDGATQYLSCTDANCGINGGATATKVDIGAGSFTISAWVYNSGAGTKGLTQAIVTKGTALGQYSYQMYLATGSASLAGPPVFDLINTTTTGGGASVYMEASSSARFSGLSVGWHHLLGVFDQTNTSITLYVDKVVAATSTSTTGTLRTDSTSDFRIGAGGVIPTKPNALGFAKVPIDEVAIWKVVPSGSQITDLYNAGAADIYPSANQYAQSTISPADISGYDYITYWVRASQAGNTVKFGFGNSVGTTNEQIVTIDAANTWQKVYYDITGIDAGARNAVTKLRVTNLTSAANTIYIDNVKAEKLMSTPSGTQITSTPRQYLQYRAVYSTTNVSYQPQLNNVTLIYNDGYKIVQQDANNTRLYNYSGSTQNLKLDVTGAGFTNLANPWTDAGSYLYPTGYESLRVYDGGGTNYLGISNSGTMATLDWNGTAALNIDAGGQIGIGATPFAPLTISTAPSGTTQYGMYLNSNMTGSSGNLGVVLIPSQSVVSSGGFYGLDVTPRFTATSGGPQANFYGTTLIPQITSAATANVTNIYSAYARVDNLSTAGSVLTNAYGLYIAAPTATGTITNKYALVTESGSGSVGIGTLTPESTLNVNSSNSNNGLFAISFNDNEQAADLSSYATGFGGALTFNMSLGLAAGQGEFDFVNRRANTNAGIQGFEFIQQTGTGTFTNLMTISGDTGRVGMGTIATPAYALDIGTTTANDRAVNALSNATTGANYAGVFGALGSGATTNTGLYTTATGATNNIGLQIDSIAAAAGNAAIYSNSDALSYFQGSVGIGAVAPGYKLEVVDNQATASAMIRNSNTATTQTVGLAIKMSASTLGNATRFINFLNAAGTIVGKVWGGSSTTAVFVPNGTDMAEFFTKDNPSATFATGTVMCQGPNGALACSPATSSKMLGVVSDSAGFLGGIEGDDKVVIGLIGQLPVLVSPTSSDIQPGDLITTGENGLAVKLTGEGFAIGRAEGSWTAASGLPTVRIALANTWADPSLAITNTGDLNIAQATDSANYVLTNNTNNSIIDKIGAFGQLVAANVKAGAVIASKVTADGFTAFQGTIDHLLVSSGLVAGNIQTKLISPLADGTDITVQIGSVATPSGQFVIQNASGSAVASIDNEGNATFSGTLYAGAIKSQSLDDIKNILSQVQTDQQLLSQVSGWNINTATNSASINSLAVTDLYVTNQAAVNSLSVTNALTLGSDLVLGSAGNNIDTLSAPLKIQSLAMAPLEIMAGLVTIDTKGNVNIAGDLFVAGRIKSSGLTLTDTQPSATDSATLLTLQNSTGNTVSTVNASGSAQFSSVSTPQLVIAGADATVSGTIVNGVITTNSTVGQAVIPANTTEITIKNPKVTDYTLVYVTPTSSTQNNVLYVKSKQVGQFVVGFATPVSTDVSFNWWIIQVQ